MKALENLALERVARAMQQGRGDVNWEVSGEITEFQGENFLLITRAVIK